MCFLKHSLNIFHDSSGKNSSGDILQVEISILLFSCLILRPKLFASLVNSSQ